MILLTLHGYKASAYIYNVTVESAALCLDWKLGQLDLEH